MEEKIEKKENIENSACCAPSSSCCGSSENMIQVPISNEKGGKIEKKEIIENSACCASSSSCCTPASSCCGSDTMKIESIPRNSEKLNIDIFVPLSACSCEWDKFMNGIFTVITPYMKNVDFQTKDLNSDEARNQGVFGNCVVVDGKTKFTNSNLLRKQLPLLLKERGLI